MSLVASLMITREWSDWYNGWYWWIQSVYVMPEYRCEGMIFQQISIIPIANEEYFSEKPTNWSVLPISTRKYSKVADGSL